MKDDLFIYDIETARERRNKLRETIIEGFCLIASVLALYVFAVILFSIEVPK